MGILLLCLGFGASVEQATNCVFRCLDDGENGLKASPSGVEERHLECPLRVTSRLHGHCVDTSAPRVEADVIGKKADVEHERLVSA